MAGPRSSGHAVFRAVPLDGRGAAAQDWIFFLVFQRRVHPQTAASKLAGRRWCTRACCACPGLVVIGPLLPSSRNIVPKAAPSTGPRAHAARRRIAAALLIPASLWASGNRATRTSRAHAPRSTTRRRSRTHMGRRVARGRTTRRPARSTRRRTRPTRPTSAGDRPHAVHADNRLTDPFEVWKRCATSATTSEARRLRHPGLDGCSARPRHWRIKEPVVAQCLGQVFIILLSSSPATTTVPHPLGRRSSSCAPRSSYCSTPAAVTQIIWLNTESTTRATTPSRPCRSSRWVMNRALLRKEWFLRLLGRATPRRRRGPREGPRTAR